MVLILSYLITQANVTTYVYCTEHDEYKNVSSGVVAN